MKKHIAKICKQAGNKLNALARVSKFLDQDKWILLMKSFVISQFNYCPIIWMYCKRQSDNLINKIHERALRIAYKDYTSDFKALLEKDCSVKIQVPPWMYFYVSTLKVPPWMYFYVSTLKVPPLDVLLCLYIKSAPWMYFYVSTLKVPPGCTSMSLH